MILFFRNIFSFLLTRAFFFLLIAVFVLSSSAGAVTVGDVDRLASDIDKTIKEALPIQSSVKQECSSQALYDKRKDVCKKYADNLGLYGEKLAQQNAKLKESYEALSAAEKAPIKQDVEGILSDSNAVVQTIRSTVQTVNAFSKSSNSSGEDSEENSDNTNTDSDESEITEQSEGNGLVPCGVGNGSPCTLCHLVKGVQNILDWGMRVMTYFALAVVVAMGILYIVSAGDSGMITTAKSGLKGALIGFALMLGSWLIINTMLVVLAKGDLGLGSGFNWFEITCDTSSSTQQGGVAAVTPTTPTGALNCKTGTCAKKADVVAAVERNAAGVDPNLFMSIIDAGEGCNNTIGRADKENSCGYGQVTARNRLRYCQLGDGSSANDCQKLWDDIDLDMACTSKFFQEAIFSEASKGCSFTNTGIVEPSSTIIMKTPHSAGYVGACWNAGATGASKYHRCGTGNYCARIQKYYNSCISQ